LTKDEAEKMRVEAESHSEEDRRKFEEVETRNRLDGVLYQAEKLLRENREKLAEADVKAAEEAIENAKKALNEGGTARLRSAMENLERSLHKIAESLYKSAPAASAPEANDQAGASSPGADAGPGQGPGSGHDQPGKKTQGDVIDAEYVDVDETKRPN
jgi:molecular chaperone DnaK